MKSNAVFFFMAMMISIFLDTRFIYMKPEIKNQSDPLRFVTHVTGVVESNHLEAVSPT